MIRTLVSILVVCTLVFFFVRWLERKMLFAATSAWELPFEPIEGGQELRFETDDGVTLSGAWIPHPAAKGVVVHCHGNAGNISHRFGMAASWRKRFQVSVLLFDYRGYGKSEGKPSEAGLVEDARAAYREARRLAGPEQPLWISGRSLGTVPAIRLACEVEAKGLLLDSPMASARAMSRAVLGFPVPSFLLASRLDNEARIQDIRCPLLIVHGQRDRIVPFDQGQRVFAAAPQAKSFVAIEGEGHNDVRDGREVLSAMRRMFGG